MAITLLTLAGCSGGGSELASVQEDPGVTANSITLGGTYPVSSSPASIYVSIARGATAYFDYINARGGVNGRQIIYKIADDAYDPTRTPAAAQELVEKDQVLLTMGNLGTAQNEAVRKYYNTRAVPQIYVNTGATEWGRDYASYPWTLGFIPNYQTESKVYARNILEDSPSARIGILRQDDAYGKDYVDGLKAGLGGLASTMVVSEQTYAAGATNLEPQFEALKASGADTLFIAALPTQSVAAILTARKVGWQPTIYLNAVSNLPLFMREAVPAGATSANNPLEIISSTFVKDPTDTPRWGSDPGVKLFKEVMTSYGNNNGGRCDPSGTDITCVWGMAEAFSLVEVFKQAGNNLTRKHVMDILCCGLNQTDNPMLLPGMVVKTTPTDHFPLKQLQLEVWSESGWALTGMVVDGRQI